jgi:hypothetical protein
MESNGDKDSGSIFERVYNGMETLCGDGMLSQRLEWLIQSIAPLRIEDFPEAMRNDFIAIMEGITAARESGATDEDRKRLAKDYLKLYTKVARLDGILQDLVGGLSTD